MPGRGAEYLRTIRVFMNPNTKVSAHRVIGCAVGQHAQLVPDDDIAWHAGSDNTEWLGIEFCQPLPADPYSEWQIDVGVAVCTDWCLTYGIKPSKETIRRHQDTDQGKSCGKSDPGELFPYDEFVARVKSAVGG